MIPNLFLCILKKSLPPKGPVDFVAYLVHVQPGADIDGIHLTTSGPPPPRGVMVTLRLGGELH